MTKPPNDFESELAEAADYHANETAFKAGGRWGYERGKAEVAQPMGLFAEIDSLKQELTEARAELERLKYGEQEWMLNCGRAAMQLKELRALAARMAEALKAHSILCAHKLLDGCKLCDAYEAFERENKG